MECSGVRIQSQVRRIRIGAERDSSVDRVQPAIVGRGCQGFLFLFGAGFPGQPRVSLLRPRHTAAVRESPAWSTLAPALISASAMGSVYSFGVHSDCCSRQRKAARSGVRPPCRFGSSGAPRSISSSVTGNWPCAAADMERCFAGNPVGLDACHPGVKSKIQHQPHGCGVSRRPQIRRAGQDSGIACVPLKWVRHGELVCFSLIRPCARGEKRIIAFE